MPVNDLIAGTGVLSNEVGIGESQPTPPETVRELEAALRGLGFSRKRAANIAQHGFKAAEAQPLQDDTQSLSKALQKLRAALKN